MHALAASRARQRRPGAVGPKDAQEAEAGLRPSEGHCGHAGAQGRNHVHHRL
jgi:hypothetical protein